MKGQFMNFHHRKDLENIFLATLPVGPANEIL